MRDFWAAQEGTAQSGKVLGWCPFLRFSPAPPSKAEEVTENQEKQKRTTNPILSISTKSHRDPSSHSTF